MPKAVFLDVDGTLVDSNEFHVSAWDEAIRDGGRMASRADIRQQIGKGADMLLPALFPDIDQARQKRNGASLWRIVQDTLSVAGESLSVCNESDRAASQRRHPRRACVIRQTGRDRLLYRIAACQAFIETTTSIDDVEASKPAGDIFASALGKLFPLGPHDAIAVGDTPYDVIAAGKCDVKTIGLLSGGFSELVLQEPGAVAIHCSVKALYEAYADSPLAK